MRVLSRAGSRSLYNRSSPSEGSSHTSSRSFSMGNSSGGDLFVAGSFRKADMVESTKRIRRQLNSMQRRTVPPNGRFLKVWDRMMLLSLVWVATVTPFEVAFVPATPVIWPLFAINRIVDVVFIADILLSFCIPFRTHPKKGGNWVYSSRAIALNYIHSWFALDLVTAIPVDVIVIMTPAIEPGSPLVKYGKFFRLLKLARLVRFNRILKR